MVAFEQDKESKPSTPSEAPTRIRLAIEYRIEGDLRFLSHHDEMRMLSRAIIRARWPLAYSQGYNPLPKLSIVLPRPVGIASSCQLAVVKLTEDEELLVRHAQLAAQMPVGCCVNRVVAIEGRGTPQPLNACYRVPIASENASSLVARIDDLMAKDTLPIIRSYGPKKPSRTVDIRRFVDDLRVTDDELQMRLNIDRQGSARPAELLQTLGLDNEKLKDRIRLMEVEWNPTLAGPQKGPATQEGPNIGQDEENHD